MTPDPPAAALTSALLDAGYRLTGPVRVGGATAWSARRLSGDSGRLVVRDLRLDDALAARLSALAGLAHEHLAPLRDVVRLPGERVAVLVGHVPGTTLAALRRVRGPFGAAETVTLAVPLADALLTLHDAGVALGALTEQGVVITPDGRPVLVELVGVPGRRAAWAPELRGAARPTPASDVWALGRLLLDHLDPRAAGSPEADELRSILATALEHDPRHRVGAAELAGACFRAVPAEPLAMPSPARLARAEGGRRGRPARPGGGHAARPAGRARAAGRDAVTTPGRVRADGRQATMPVRRSRVRADEVCGVRWPPGRALAALVVLATVVGGGAAVAAGLRDVDGGGGPGPLGSRVSQAVPVAPDLDPLRAARALTTTRAAALSAGEVTALAQASVVGSPAWWADAAVLAEARRAGVGVSARVVGEAALGPVPPRPVRGDRARVRVTTVTAVTVPRPPAAGATVAPAADTTTTATAAAPLGDAAPLADATPTAPVPPTPPRTVDLVLVWTSAGWRVAEVLEPGR